LKLDKLASFEDKLREAKDGKDFGKVLEAIKLQARELMVNWRKRQQSSRLT